MTNLLSEIGALALGTRLRRLSDQLFGQVNDLYADDGISVNSRFFPILRALMNHEGRGVVEISESLGVTHALVSGLLKEMESAGLVTLQTSTADARVRLASLSAEGRKMVGALGATWDTLAKVLETLVATESPLLMGYLANIEAALKRLPLNERVKRSRQQQPVEIFEWREEYAGVFRDLNLHWIEEHFSVEEADRKYLDEQRKMIIDRGGMIFFARCDGTIAGTVGLLPDRGGGVELIKMAVSPAFRGRGIGRTLLLHVITYARAQGRSRIWLESATKLGVAIQLYRSVGFTEIRNWKSTYERVDIAMELSLGSKPKKKLRARKKG